MEPPLSGSSMSAVRFERAAHHGSTWCVSACQRRPCAPTATRTQDLPLRRSSPPSAPAAETLVGAGSLVVSLPPDVGGSGPVLARGRHGHLAGRYWSAAKTLCLQGTFTLSVTVAGLGLSLFPVRPGRPSSDLVVVRTGGQPNRPAATGCTAISSYVKMGRMQRLSRVTPATLDVLAVLVWSPDDQHGFALAKAAGRPTGSVYVILNRLEEAGMVDSYWETANVENEGRPRRRFYRMTPDGLGTARAILAERNYKPRSNLSPGSARRKLGLDLPGGVQ
jgi:PadR family transcriptional regulator PadR